VKAGKKKWNQENFNMAMKLNMHAFLLTK